MKRSICFVALNAYPLIKKTSNKLIGGAELQQTLIGAELANRGYSVSFITLDHGQKAVSREGQFEVLSSFRPSGGISVLRFIYPRLVKIWQALNRTNADIYYCRCAGFLLGVVVFWARLNKKKVIFCGAADSNFDPKNVDLKYSRDKAIYLWGLTRCSAIVVQSLLQKNLLKKNFGRNSVIVHNGMKNHNGILSPKKSILWVGNIVRIKKPDKFIDIVKCFPNENFVMVGGKVDGQQELYDYIVREIKILPNLKFRGMLSLDETEKEFNAAKIFVNTSLQEGFPNTFLQAWRQGVPVVSFVDPDGLIANHSLGQVARDSEDMVNKLKKILLQGNNLNSELIKSYFNENLLIEKQVDKYERIFDSLVK
jgi:glycosyltransferase involved in cell wall biosynthesis